MQRCSIVEVRVGRGEKVGELESEGFDRVLLDVPCSGEGRFVVFEPATSRGWSRKVVTDSVRLQRKLMASGAQALKPGGVLVYSTCTLNREENERLILWAMESFPLEVERIPVRIPGAYAGMTRGMHACLAHALRIFPDPEREGFFVCRMRKKA
jgi:16S rRNA C967 or C1407 C5-methylase (RsmB/RsmF family)